MSAVDLIKNKITEEKVYEILNLAGAKNITKVGNSIRCCCPLHGGHNLTAFKWDLDENVWICHSGDCGGGDFFSFVAHINDLSIDHDFVHVMKIAAEFLGIDISTLQMDEIRSQFERERGQWLRYMKNKLNKKVNEPYDLHNLGDLYKLNNYLTLPSDLLNEYGVYYSKEYNRIAFTLKDVNGNIIGASLRRVNESEKIKWLHRPKSILTGHMLYNLNNVGDFPAVYIVEGIKDLLRLKMLGVDNVVSTLGVNITMEQVNLLSRFFSVIIVYDNDNGGKKGTLKAIKFLRNIFNLEIIDLADIKVNDPYEIDSIETFNSLKRYKPYQYLEKYNLTFSDLK